MSKRRLIEADYQKCRKAIEKQLKAQKIVRDYDANLLYLSNIDVEDCYSLEHFINLHKLFLSSNKIRFLNFLSKNLRLSELYLHNNKIVSIKGCLSHLTGLKILTLNNNQLSRMEETVSELKNMQALHNLNLFQNPLTSEAIYRTYTIYFLPFLKVLDQRLINPEDRSKARDCFEQQRAILNRSIGFGSKCSTESQNVNFDPQPTTLPENEVANNFLRQPLDDLERAQCIRANQRALMEYSRFDWGKVPTVEERRQGQEVSPQIVTVRFQ